MSISRKIEHKLGRSEILYHAIWDGVEWWYRDGVEWWYRDGVEGWYRDGVEWWYRDGVEGW